MEVLLNGNEITVSFTEPTTNKNGTPLKDLARTSIYTKIAGAVAKQLDVTASGLTGGGSVSKKITVSVAEDEEVDVEVYATASDISGNESVSSVSTVVRIDRMAPAAPV